MSNYTLRWHGGLSVTRPMALLTVESHPLTRWERIQVALYGGLYIAAFIGGFIVLALLGPQAVAMALGAFVVTLVFGARR